MKLPALSAMVSSERPVLTLRVPPFSNSVQRFKLFLACRTKARRAKFFRTQIICERFHIGTALYVVTVRVGRWIFLVHHTPDATLGAGE
jgi:hypothetical protein